MFKAEIGDFLYIIIFVVLMIAGVLEKIAKAKRQQQPTPPPQSYDDFEDVEQPSAPPQTLEEMLRRMMQTNETQGYSEDAQSLEPVPVAEPQSLEYAPHTSRYQYQPIVVPVADQAEREAFAQTPIEEMKAGDINEFQFDIRQAVIASEILNRKY